MIKNNPFMKTLKSSTGQVAVILILVIAVALIFYAVTLNFSRLSGAKTLVTVASNGSAGQLASDMASYGQAISEASLKGRRKICGWTGAFAAIITVVIIVIAIVAAYYGRPDVSMTLLESVGALALVGLALAVVALVLQVSVIQPGITDAWNRRITKTLSQRNQFTENAIQAALRKTVTDNVRVPDVNDMDLDRVWGYDTDGNPLDEISRFSVYYTKRMRDIRAGEEAEIQDFLDALAEFLIEGNDGWGIYDPIEPACNGSAQCVPCCVPNAVTLYGEAYPALESCADMDPCPADCSDCSSGSSDTYQPSFRPEGCPDDATVLAGCRAHSPYGVNYPWVYDPFYENPDNAFFSFRELLGHDDEQRNYFKNPDNPNAVPQALEVPGDEGFHLKDTTGFYAPPFYSPTVPDNKTGIFPFFYKMGDWGTDLSALDVVLNPLECHWCDQRDVVDCIVCAAIPPHPAEIPQLDLPMDPADPSIVYNKSYVVDGIDNPFDIPPNPPLAVDKVDLPPNILADDAAWREQEWGRLSLWLKGDGSASRVTLVLEEDAKEHPTFSKAIPLDSREWRRFSFSLRTFWNRGKRRIKPAKLRRLYFGGTPAQSFTVDRIALAESHREIPLERVESKGELAFADPDLLELGPGRYALRLIPPPQPAESSVRVTLSLVAEAGGRKATRTLNLPLAPGCDEATASLNLPVERDTDVDFRVRVRGASGKEGSMHSRFPTFARQPLAATPHLAICPLPKEMKPGEGAFLLTPDTRIAAPPSPSRELRCCVELLQAELEKWYGLVLEAGADAGARNSVVLELRDVGLPAEGYQLDVTPGGVAIRGRDCRGLYYGIQTLLQAIADSTAAPHAPMAKCVEIRDWPSLPTRSAMIILPVDKWGYPHDPNVKVEDFLDFLYNTLARHKYNTLVLNMRHGYRFECAPKTGAKHAWGRAELERIRDFCARHFLEVIPNLNSMGHMGWLLYRHTELRWHDDMNMLCTCNPKSYEILTSAYDELIDIFKPRVFHIGMDEVRWRGGKQPEKIKSCACDSLPTWEQYGRWAKKLHGRLKQKGVRTMMWGDMLLVEHGGGPKFFTSRALPGLPRDILIGNWSAGVAPKGNFFFNQECGFPAVLQANSFGVNADQSPYLTGNMFGVWNKSPWLSQRDRPGSQNFCYLGLIHAAEFSWNLNRTDEDVAKRVHSKYFDLREASVLRTLALQPEPNAGKDMTPLDLGNGEPISVSRIDFRRPAAGAPVRLAAGESKSIPFGGAAASLYFLHAEELPDEGEQAETFRNRWQKAENVWGIPVGRYEIVYDDGSLEAAPIKHTWNILPQRMVRTLPHAYRVIGTHRLPGDARDAANALYAAQWVNPHPEKRIKEVRMVCGDTEAVLLLFGVTARL